MNEDAEEQDIAVCVLHFKSPQTIIVVLEGRKNSTLRDDNSAASASGSGTEDSVPSGDALRDISRVVRHGSWHLPFTKPALSSCSWPAAWPATFSKQTINRTQSREAAARPKTALSLEWIVVPSDIHTCRIGLKQAGIWPGDLTFLCLRPRASPRSSPGLSRRIW